MEKFEAFLARFGERTGDGWGAETVLTRPTWREQPQQVFRLMKMYLTPGTVLPAEVRAQGKFEREALLETLFRGCPDPVAIQDFRVELADARKVATVLEIHNHYIDQMSTGQLRRAVMAAAHLLQERSILSRTEDTFYLYFNEILTALRSDSPISLGDSIANRQATHQKWQKMEAPPILGVPDPILPERRLWMDDTTPPNPSREGLLIRLPGVC